MWRMTSSYNALWNSWGDIGGRVTAARLSAATLRKPTRGMAEEAGGHPSTFGRIPRYRRTPWHHRWRYESPEAIPSAARPVAVQSLGSIPSNRPGPSTSALRRPWNERSSGFFRGSSPVSRQSHVVRAISGEKRHTALPCRRASGGAIGHPVRIPASTVIYQRADDPPPEGERSAVCRRLRQDLKSGSWSILWTIRRFRQG